ncbi:hypothetical protein [Luteibacter sp. 9133]|uniref:hypothetical protein n=1 Tax=Luteibacter sp. 9133 TaxID=1500891 RepID=UPI0005B7D88B|nr:hypothetical protein [Luteibacter sp. 9133]
MTMHTWTTYRCDCGHIGAAHTKENDQPYSANWGVTTLEGLGGTEQAPTCGACHHPLGAGHIVPGKPREYPAPDGRTP